MREVTQTITVGDGSGMPGNCLQAAVASLLGLDLDDVPHLALHEDWLERLVDFGRLVGYRIVHRPSSKPVDFGLAFGPSPRNVMHAVAIENDKTWDPHPSRAGLVSVSLYLDWLPIGGAGS